MNKFDYNAWITPLYFDNYSYPSIEEASKYSVDLEIWGSTGKMDIARDLLARLQKYELINFKYNPPIYRSTTRAIVRFQYTDSNLSELTEIIEKEIPEIDKIIIYKFDYNQRVEYKNGKLYSNNKEVTFKSGVKVNLMDLPKERHTKTIWESKDKLHLNEYFSVDVDSSGEYDYIIYDQDYWFDGSDILEDDISDLRDYAYENADFGSANGEISYAMESDDDIISRFSEFVMDNEGSLDLEDVVDNFKEEHPEHYDPNTVVKNFLLDKENLDNLCDYFDARYISNPEDFVNWIFEDSPSDEVQEFKDTIEDWSSELLEVEDNLESNTNIEKLINIYQDTDNMTLED